MKNSLLFVVGKVHPNSSQGVRYANLLRYFLFENTISIVSHNKLVENLNSESECLELVGQSANNKRGYLGIYLFYKSLFKKIVEPLIFPDRIIFKLPGYIGNLKRMSRERQFDYVIIGMTPYSLYILIYFIKKYFKKAKLIIDLSDPFVENQGLNYPGFIKKYLVPFYESFFLKYVDCIVVLNPRIKELYLTQYSSIITESKIKVIEQGFNLSVSENFNIKQMSSPISIVYAGVFVSGLREPFELYKALELMGAICKLDLYGNISGKYVPESKSINYEYHGTVNQTDLFDVYSNSDLLVMIDNKNGYQVPGKTLELAAIKKPVLFLYENEDSPTLYYVHKIPSFFRIKNERNEIVKFLKSFIEGEISPKYDCNIDKYSWENLSKKYVNILGELNPADKEIE